MGEAKVGFSYEYNRPREVGAPTYKREANWYVDMKGGNRPLRSVVTQVDVLPPGVLPGPIEHRGP